MEVNAQLLSLQSTLRNLEKKINTPFCKIKYKGGNEDKLEEIHYAIKTHTEQLNDLKFKKDFLLFLIVNTNLNHNSLKNINEYQHLVNFIPLLSTCLLSNIIIQLNFADAYAEILPTISLQDNSEILFELEKCLKFCDLSKTLKDTCVVLDAVIKLFLISNQNDGDQLERIAVIFKEMLENLSKFNLDKVKNWTHIRIQQHIGYTLLHVLQLLNKCPTSIKKLNDSLINSAITIMKAVTLDVFCTWAEVQYEDGTCLQLIVAGEAYNCIEHLQKFSPGTTLVQMLSTIAKKPMTLAEKIQNADLETIINNVNSNKENQRKWFCALINNYDFDKKVAVKCLNKWHHLCTPEDISILLPLGSNADDSRILLLKCTSTLKMDDLKSVIFKYFRDYSDDWNVNITNDLILLFNKMQSDTEIDDGTLKQIYLLLIQNRKMFLRTLYTNCLNTVVNVKNFKSVFSHIKDIIEINYVAKNIFLEVFENNFVCDENIIAYKELLNVLTDLKYLTCQVVLSKVFLPQLKKLQEAGAFSSLCSTLRVLNIISLKYMLDSEIVPFLTFLFGLMEHHRKSPIFIQHHRTVQECVYLILKFAKNGPYPLFEDELNGLHLNPINKLYLRKLLGKTDDRFLKHLFTNWNLNEEAHSVAVLMKVLPISVKTEWFLIISEIEIEGDYEATLNLLNRVLYLLSQINSCRECPEDDDDLLMFCLQHYLLVVKELLQPKHNNLIEERVLIKSVCALIDDLPAKVCKKQYMTLLGLLSDDALKSLKHDREFIVSLIAVKDINVSQILAQRILS
ncbi:hypothetical protein FQR65_LT15076 [Abscondita terminalis]|nr:hypothetical protein FQR65_LT15076 [Abscondita terminalis]